MKLISDEYRMLQTEMHKNPAYGVASIGYAPLVAKFIRETEWSGGMHSDTILDYGAGKGRLGLALQRQFHASLLVHHYDPAIPEWSALPEPCRFVACIDVLEHIEPEFLDGVLEDLRRVTLKWGFFTVHTGPAIKTLPDGRNAHLIQESVAWWLLKLMRRFDLCEFKRVQNGFWVFVTKP